MKSAVNNPVAGNSPTQTSPRFGVLSSGVEFSAQLGERV
jgi:hypothetical protein